MGLSGDVRHDTYGLIAGDPLNVVVGGYIIPSGYHAGNRPYPYLQGVHFVAPNDAGSASRNFYSAFVELSLTPQPTLFLGVAGRVQHYDDSAGLRGNFKLSGRYEFTPGSAVRGSAGTGFRAPSLQQQAFQQINAAIQTTSNRYATALGAKALQAENARDYRVGLTLSRVGSSS